MVSTHSKRIHVDPPIASPYLRIEQVRMASICESAIIEE